MDKRHEQVFQKKVKMVIKSEKMLPSLISKDKHIKKCNSILNLSYMGKVKSSNDTWYCSCVESTQAQSLLVGIELKSRIPMFYTQVV